MVYIIRKECFMTKHTNIINLAVIAHVNAGKSTLVDAFLNQSGVFRENEEVEEFIMDSNELEKERGITIYAKNCSIEHDGYKINIVDTPGHADFSSEVERIIKAVDTTILVVDSSEGPMPQTRFVLKKSLEQGIKPILFINKMDKNSERAEEVVDMVLDLFIDLQADDKQLEFPIIYGIAKDGIANKNIDGDSNDLTPLFETIIDHVEPYPDLSDEPLQLQIHDLAYDDYLGRIGIGRIYSGSISKKQNVAVSKRDGSVKNEKVTELLGYKGLSQISTEKAGSGDIVAVAGIPHISIGETICDVDKVKPMDTIRIDEPTLSMNFSVNDSPFSGQSGKYLTSRNLKARLEKEQEVNVGLNVEKLEGSKGFKVSGRGELHLSILLEHMRREGYEVSVSKPEVLYKEEGNKLLEPVERVIVEVPEKYSGTVISELNQRKGLMQSMDKDSDYIRLNYLVPTRGLIGYKSQFITDTSGEGTLIRSFDRYEEYKGKIPQRTNGDLISQKEGVARAYALDNLSERGKIFIKPGTKVYEGMIIGMNNKDNDLTVNPCKNKKLTNMRASGSDDSVNLAPPKEFTLEEALEYIKDDELVEVTPDAIRLRKKILDENLRKKQEKYN